MMSHAFLVNIPNLRLSGDMNGTLTVMLTFIFPLLADIIQYAFCSFFIGVVLTRFIRILGSQFGATLIDPVCGDNRLSPEFKSRSGEERYLSGLNNKL